MQRVSPRPPSVSGAPPRVGASARERSATAIPPPRVRAPTGAITCTEGSKRLLKGRAHGWSATTGRSVSAGAQRHCDTATTGASAHGCDNLHRREQAPPERARPRVERHHGSERQRGSAEPLRYRHHGSDHHLRNATPTRVGAPTRRSAGLDTEPRQHEPAHTPPGSLPLVLLNGLCLIGARA